MARNTNLRTAPTNLLPGARSLITVQLPYPAPPTEMRAALAAPERAYISRYALGRDYHKVVRQRLIQLAHHIETQWGDATPVLSRACTDSAPLAEVEFAHQAGSGWRGKHTLLLTRQGSWFFLGELLTTLELPPDPPPAKDAHCGTCQHCLDVCPTRAFVKPYVLDARRCISYLTIEHTGSIPEPLRPLLGNRIYGCDDCQLFCPWNEKAGRVGQPMETAPDFQPRHGLNQATLVALFAWSETEFSTRLEGSPIRRIGWERWLRNIAVALGNVPAGTLHATAALAALHSRREHPSALIREHVEWAIQRLR